RQLGQDRLRLDRLEAELEQRQEVLAYEIKQHEESVQNWNDQRAQSEAEFEKLQREIAEARHVLAERARIEADLAEREANLQEAQAELAHQQQLLDHRLARVNHLRHRLLQRRQVLQGQLQNIIHSETAQESLQEQLRRRTAVLTQREQAQKQLEDTYQTRLDELEKSELAWKSKQAEWLVQQQKEREALDERHRLLDEQALQIQKDQQILTELQQQLLSQKQQIAEERQAAKQEQQAAQARQAELESARRHWEEAMPKFLRSAESALERVITVRSQLRSQLLEIHAYRQRCYEEISNRKSEVQALAHQLEKQQQVLMRLQDEQKLEAAALKQDVLHWQAQLQLLKENWQASQTDISEKEQRLEHRARELEQSQNRLQLQSSELQNRERDIQYRRSEVNKHLADMQGWYRLKLRDMADKKLPHGASDLDTELIDPPHILPLKSTRAGTDEHLADLLNGMGLIDAATLKTLMEEAARQRISLRDCLLQNDFLTSFQLELIETGRMESLVLGPLRIIDRLRTGTMETIYRVFDPRLGD
ncbi:MAG TPA: hypothetical protein PKA06_14275, partial [Gemmatales bacterium]|nr:hypothetical protein [Gemmatales bacterium]